MPEDSFINMSQRHTIKFIAFLMLALGFVYPCIESVHIVLGDSFSNPDSNVLYRIGGMLKNPANEACLDEVTAKLTFANGHTQSYNVSSKTPYAYHNWVDPLKHDKEGDDRRLEYERIFAFIDIIEPEEPNGFTYEILYKGERHKGPFEFKSNILKDDQPMKVITFGDHDLAKGIPTIEAVAKREYDLLLLLGDYAYDIYEENGQKGDDYFEAMEQLLTKAPVVIATGNHERIDSFQMLNSRFKSSSEGDELAKRGVFFKKIRNTLVVVFNWDFTFANKDSYQETVSFLRKTLERYDNDESVKFRFFVSHRALYCSYINQKDLNFKPECQSQIFYQKQVDDLLSKHGVDLIISGHLHYYERLAPMINYQLVREGPVQLIVGSGGTAHFFKKMPIPKVEYQKALRQVILGFVELSITPNSVTSRFIAAKSGKQLDTYVLNKAVSRRITTSGLAGSVVLFILLGLIALIAVKICRYRHVDREFLNNAEFKKAIDNYRLASNGKDKDALGIITES